MTAGSHTPRLQTGLTVLDRPARRSPALHRLALAEFAERDGAVYWLDARNEAATYALYDLAPSRARLSDVRVARAFTAYQHHELVREVARTAGDAGLVVAPCVASLYRDDDVPEWEAADLFESSLAVLSGLAESLDAPVLTTADRDAGGPYADLLADRADAEIECTRTDAGLKYVADDFETTVYLDDGFWQTTIPYWIELLGAVVEDDPAVAAETMGLVDGVGV